MSKSVGNISPAAGIIKESGAEILRLWVSMSEFTARLRVSKEILTRVSDVDRKLRNTCRILVANLYDFDPETACRGEAGRGRPLRPGRVSPSGCWRIGRPTSEYEFATAAQACRCWPRWTSAPSTSMSPRTGCTRWRAVARETIDADRDVPHRATGWRVCSRRSANHGRYALDAPAGAARSVGAPRGFPSDRPLPRSRADRAVVVCSKCARPSSPQLEEQRKLKVIGTSLGARSASPLSERSAPSSRPHQDSAADAVHCLGRRAHGDLTPASPDNGGG